MSRINTSEQKNQALREMFEPGFEAGGERELMLSELIRLTTEKTLQEMLELEQSELGVRTGASGVILRFCYFGESN